MKFTGKNVRDWMLHFAGGAAIAGSTLGIGYAIGSPMTVWFGPPVALLLPGFLREGWQRGFAKWSGHATSEAVAWGVGALAVAGGATYALGVIAAVR